MFTLGTFRLLFFEDGKVRKMLLPGVVGCVLEEGIAGRVLIRDPSARLRGLLCPPKLDVEEEEEEAK